MQAASGTEDVRARKVSPNTSSADYNLCNRRFQPGQTPIPPPNSVRQRHSNPSHHAGAPVVSGGASPPGDSAMTTEDEEQGNSAERTPGCCVSFWGPFKPNAYFGGHSVAECAESLYLPTSVLFAYRLLAFLFILSVDIYLIVRGIYRLQYYTILSSAMITVTFFLLTLCSFLTLIDRSGLIHSTRAANIIVPLHFIAGASSIYLTPVYYTILNAIYFNWWNAVLHGGTLLLFIFDFVLGAAFSPKMSYIALFFVFNLAYLAFVWIRHAIWRTHPDYNVLYPFFEHWNQPTGFVIGLYAALVIGTIIVGFIALLITRITFCCGSNRNRQK